MDLSKLKLFVERPENVMVTSEVTASGVGRKEKLGDQEDSNGIRG